MISLNARRLARLVPSSSYFSISWRGGFETQHVPQSCSTPIKHFGQPCTSRSVKSTTLNKKTWWCFCVWRGLAARSGLRVHTWNRLLWHKCLYRHYWGISQGEGYSRLSQCDSQARCHQTARVANCHGYWEYPCSENAGRLKASYTWHQRGIYFPQKELPRSELTRKMWKRNESAAHMLNISRCPLFCPFDCSFVVHWSSFVHWKLFFFEAMQCE